MRILFVAMAYSVHTARWVSQFAQTGWDIHVFDMQEGTVGPELSGATAYTFCPPPRRPIHLKALHTAWPFRRGAYAAKRYLPPVLRRTLLPSRIDTLAALIPRLRPDILHSLEMQHETYPLLEVSRRLGGRFAMPWVYSSWGSDLYLFKNDPGHEARIREVLSRCDYYVPDCQRDISLAQSLGFSGKVPGVFLVCGGIDVAASRQLITPGPSSARRVVAIKGYQGWAGRAMTALRALETCVDVLAGYTVEIYLADDATRDAAHSLSTRTGIPIRIIPPGPPAEILRLMGRARVAVGMSISDGSPISMIEAMMMGALPIQSNTVSTAEWIDTGKNGLLVAPEDWRATGAALRRGLTDATLVDEAAAINLEIICRRVEGSVVRPQIMNMYSQIVEQGGRA